MTVTLVETRKVKIDNEIRRRDHADVGRKAWIHAYMMSNTWVTSCPKEHGALNAKQFPVVAQTYFGVGQTCMVGLVGQTIRQKA